MREGLFLKKNVEKWKQYQFNQQADPDETAKRFTELVDDLGYAKTFYPESRVTRYLNGLASRIYLDIYRNKRERGSRILRFWKTDLPLVAYKHRRELFWAFIFFTAMALMAAFSAAHDDSFIRGILGDGYVEMTEENISSGDPFGVYKDENRMEMFLRIALNNIQVSFLVFVGGLFLSIGSVWLLFTNGVMVGAFQYMFFAKGLGFDSVLVIWIHGTLEISAIVISGAAGFILGNSILFPGTRKRLESLKVGAKHGVMLMMGLVPVFIAAAFLEGFVTRLTHMPKALSISILAISFIFIIWYFVIYPAIVNRRSQSAELL